MKKVCLPAVGAKFRAIASAELKVERNINMIQRISHVNLSLDLKNGTIPASSKLSPKKGKISPRGAKPRSPSSNIISKRTKPPSTKPPLRLSQGAREIQSEDEPGLVGESGTGVSAAAPEGPGPRGREEPGA